MGCGLVFFVTLLLVVGAIGHVLCVGSFLVEDSIMSTETSQLGGITASLIHRDEHFVDDIVGLTHREKMERAMRISKKRADFLVSKRRLTGEASSPSTSPNPGPGTADWETPLSFFAASYLMRISLGTPAKTYLAIADTGSDLTWLQCSPCQACPSGTCGECQNGVYDPTSSSTYAPLGCSSTTCQFLNETGSFCPGSADGNTTGCAFGYAYGDGSQISGTIAQETISLEEVTGVTQTVPNYWFGCSHKAASNSSLLDGTDGLVGLGRGNISFPTQLGTYFGNKFGYCLVKRSAVDANSSVSSPLYFGSDAVPVIAKNATELQYTPMVSTPLSPSTFYYVGCTGISVGGKLITKIPASAFDIQTDGSGGIFFDSGTTYTSLSEKIYTPLSDAIQQQITTYIQDTTHLSGFSLCYFAKWSDWINDYGKGVPIISFQWTNTSGLPLFVDTAWVQYDDITVCLAMSNSTGSESIFGSYQMVNYHILYDSGNKQIGFVPANCTGVQSSNSPIARVSTSLVTGLLSLLLVLVLTLK